MCNDCCKQLKGWLKSFTKTETALCVLEVILLIILIGFLIFLVLHLIACSKKDTYKLSSNYDTHETIPANESTTQKSTISNESSSQVFQTKTDKTDSEESNDQTEMSSTRHTTTVTIKTSKPECTWMPSFKTSPSVQYYHTPRSTKRKSTVKWVKDIDELAYDDQSDGEEVNEPYKSFVLALVKVKPPSGTTFGCILTVVSSRWTVTAASCVESIEEVDSLDTFVIMEGYGSVGRGRTHSVADVVVHPMYEGVNRSYDLVALKSEDVLSRSRPVQIASLVDHFMITIGERFSLLGFGQFRSILRTDSARTIHAVNVYTLPSSQCPATQGGWSTRLLLHGAPLSHAACGAAPLCAGVLYSRGTPCNYCAGAPLLRDSLLYGVMSDNDQCGAACEPALYVNMALVKDWLESVIVSI